MMLRLFGLVFGCCVSVFVYLRFVCVDSNCIWFVVFSRCGVVFVDVL